MSLLTFPNGTITIAQGSSVGTVTGGDLTPVVAGMTLNFGSRVRKKGDAYLIAGVAANGTSGGTITLSDAVDTAYTNAPFIVDTGAYSGGAAALAVNLLTRIINYLQAFLGIGTSLDAASRIAVLDKANASAVSQWIWRIAGRRWFTVEQMTRSGVEYLVARAYPDGTTPVDAWRINGSTGGVELPGIEKVTAVGDATYNALASDRVVALTAALSAPRTWTLPGANSVPAGYTIRVVDVIGGVSATNTLTIAPGASGDTVDGLGNIVLGSPNASVVFISNGTNRWSFDVRPVAMGGTGARDAATARANLGIGAAATRNVGTTAGTLAAGDDSRIVGAMPKSGGTFTGDITVQRATAPTTGYIPLGNGTQAIGYDGSSLTFTQGKGEFYADGFRTWGGARLTTNGDVFMPYANDYLSNVLATKAATSSLGNSATRSIGTAAGTVAAGDDIRITGALQPSGNLAGLASVATARANLSAAKSGANSDITSITGMTTPLSPAQGGTGNTGGAWTPYTPTFSAPSGSFAAASASGRYKKNDTTCTAEIVFAVSNVGTAAGFVFVGLPIPAAQAACGPGRENATTGKMVQFFVSAGNAAGQLFNYDGSFPSPSGSSVTATLIYEVAP